MSPFLLGVSLSLQDRALGGAYTFAHGKRPAFFVLGHHLVRRISNSPKAAMLTSFVPEVNCLSLYSQNYIRLVFAYLIAQNKDANPNRY